MLEEFLLDPQTSTGEKHEDWLSVQLKHWTVLVGKLDKRKKL